MQSRNDRSNIAAKENNGALAIVVVFVLHDPVGALGGGIGGGGGGAYSGGVCGGGCGGGGGGGGGGDDAHGAVEREGVHR